MSWGRVEREKIITYHRSPVLNVLSSICKVKRVSFQLIHLTHQKFKSMFLNETLSHRYQTGTQPSMNPSQEVSGSSCGEKLSNITLGNHRLFRVWGGFLLRFKGKIHLCY